MKYLFLMILFSLSGAALACTEDGKEGFLPDNDMFIPVGAKSAGGLTEAQFNNVIDRLEAIYTPIASNMGGRLSISRKWEDGTVNASAMRFGSSWMVNMYGGLARHKTITEDGFALVLCHEIGHHIGGAPKIKSFPWINRWASNEGQSDYFATLKCLRQLFLNDDNAAVISSMNVPGVLSNACYKAHGDKRDAEICIRGAMAGASVSNLFADMRSQPQGRFDTPDTSVVRKTDNSHPAHQCRLDTYFQGALCEKGMNEDVSQKDEVQGTCHGKTGYKSGLRPLCWFKPKK
jgi:hypothetical protein